MPKTRLDVLLVERGLCESREKAQRLILAGHVRVNGETRIKASLELPPESAVSLDAPDRFVSRGGEKLEAAMAQFQLDASGRICADIGASTGGFTDCLLQRGAARVYAVDVGRGQLHWKLQGDPRVVRMEGVNARHLDPARFPDRPSLVTVDASFISLTLILPAVTQVLSRPGDLVTLIKPQFEAGRDDVGKGGVVRDPAVHRRVVEQVRSFGSEGLGLEWKGVCESPLLGPAGNKEFLAWWKAA
jgi:23S rRNA (cytidine1920-2'-O)/16S rRNA (cytidine1409-2'-O)-methyltransferase